MGTRGGENITGVCASVMTPFSLFLLSRKGDKIEVCLAICHRRFWRSRAKLQIWPWGNLLEWGAVVICLGARINKKQQSSVMADNEEAAKMNFINLFITNLRRVYPLDSEPVVNVCKVCMFMPEYISFCSKAVTGCPTIFERRVITYKPFWEECRPVSIMYFVSLLPS